MTPCPRFSNSLGIQTGAASSPVPGFDLSKPVITHLPSLTFPELSEDPKCVNYPRMTQNKQRPYNLSSSFEIVHVVD